MSASDFTIVQGATFLLTMQWLSSGIPVNLTGYTARLKILQNASTQNEQIYLTFASDGTGTANTSLTLGGAAGTLALRAEASVTINLGFTKAPYVLLLKEPDNLTVVPLASGQVTVTPGVGF